MQPPQSSCTRGGQQYPIARALPGAGPPERIAAAGTDPTNIEGEGGAASSPTSRNPSDHRARMESFLASKVPSQRGGACCNCGRRGQTGREAGRREYRPAR